MNNLFLLRMLELRARSSPTMRMSTARSHRSGGDDRDGDVTGEVLDGDVPGVDTAAAGEVDTVADGDGRY
jgi:hypothetical protein